MWVSRLLLHNVNDQRRRINTKTTSKMIIHASTRHTTMLRKFCVHRTTIYILHSFTRKCRMVEHIKCSCVSKIVLISQHHIRVRLALFSRFSNDKQMAKVLSVHKSSVSIPAKKRIIGIRHCVYIVDCLHIHRAVLVW